MVPHLNLVAAPLLTMLLAHVGIPQAFMSLATRTLPMPLRISLPLRISSTSTPTLCLALLPRTRLFCPELSALPLAYPSLEAIVSHQLQSWCPTPTGSNCDCVQPSTVIKDYLYYLIAYTYCNGIVGTSATLNSAFIDECTVLYFWKDSD